MVFTLSWFGTPSMHLHSGVGVVFPLNLTPTRQGCLHLFIGVGFAPPFICGFSSPTCFLLTGYSGARAPPGAGRDPLEEMFGVRMVDHESLFVVFFETFGSCDSQLDCFTALRGTDSLPTVLCVGGWRVVVRMGLCLKDESTAGTDMTCQILLIKFLDVSAVLRACCASVHSFLVWVCLGKRLLGYPTIAGSSEPDQPPQLSDLPPPPPETVRPVSPCDVAGSSEPDQPDLPPPPPETVRPVSPCDVAGSSEPDQPDLPPPPPETVRPVSPCDVAGSSEPDQPPQLSDLPPPPPETERPVSLCDVAGSSEPDQPPPPPDTPPSMRERPASPSYIAGSSEQDRPPSLPVLPPGGGPACPT
ncbi:hypothetical protein PAPYR_12852 [Paratrimastix pyriformis]|uniref:Uncharacterized protein n=1 Tax=Paratrimastix pyriformis TaxID=342808 RepID=A0ABQ8U184_9EUKA|nr:hypothetical protein PAPYR_12852 [Paratrimastix pyriformis]